MENRNNKVLLTVIGAATLLVAMVGATFAYFSATSESDVQQVTTGSSTIAIDATNNSVTNIKPTTFDKAAADAGTNTDIVKITLTVTGNSTSEGKYTISMNEPAITIGDIENDKGVVGDIKYTVYEGDAQKVAPTSFTGTETVTDLFTTTYNAGDITGTYNVYVYIDNKDAEQNNLQDVSFNVSFNANATTQL